MFYIKINKHFLWCLISDQFKHPQTLLRWNLCGQDHLHQFEMKGHFNTTAHWFMLDPRKEIVLFNNTFNTFYLTSDVCD